MQCNTNAHLTAMRGRQKGGAKAPQITHPQGLGALVSSFLERLSSRDYSQPSIDAHRWALRQFTGWADARGEHDPAAFTRADLEAYQLFLHNYRSPRGGKPLVTNTQVARLGCVRRFFAWLCRDGLIPANPAADLDLPRKQAQQLPKNLSEYEIQLLLAIPNIADPFGLRDRTILELFYATGVRRTEMTQLDHGDYDSSAKTLLIRKGKNGKSRLLPVGERAASWLDRYLAEIRPQFDFLPNETALFLTGYGSRYTPAYLGNWVSKLLKKAGIDKPGACHLFRHSCATDMHIGGADIRFVQEMLGHARLETTQIYTHVNISALQEVHARTHPHGILKDNAEFVGPDNSSIGEDFQTEEISAFNLSPDLLDATKEMPAVLTDLTANTIPVSYRIYEEDSDPNDEDFPPETGPSTPPKRPGPQNPTNSHNSFTSNSVQQNETRLERGRVIYYQYRYYDPLTGRWPSRDPIGEEGGVNLYAMLKNSPVHNHDYIGLAIRMTLTDPPSYNCKGDLLWAAINYHIGGLTTGQKYFLVVDYNIKHRFFDLSGSAAKWEDGGEQSYAVGAFFTADGTRYLYPRWAPIMQGDGWAKPTYSLDGNMTNLEIDVVATLYKDSDGVFDIGDFRKFGLSQPAAPRGFNGETPSPRREDWLDDAFHYAALHSGGSLNRPIPSGALLIQSNTTKLTLAVNCCGSNPSGYYKSNLWIFSDYSQRGETTGIPMKKAP